MNNNYLKNQPNNPIKKTTLNSIDPNDINLDETMESDSLTEIYNIIKGELDLIGKIIYLYTYFLTLTV